MQHEVAALLVVLGGDDPDDSCKNANVKDKSDATNILDLGEHHRCDDGYQFVAPVRTYQSNTYGLFDMIGNVYEWTLDAMHEDFVGAPNDGSPWLKDGNLEKRVIRGGSFLNGTDTTRSAHRAGVPNAFRASILGFRLARSL
jgi:formylglycine-generating enzyme required for sulfatase activity